ncbi:hypothetical protein DFH11DRAFT_1879439, partial [Phellopilus nigrolimitatus]
MEKVSCHIQAQVFSPSKRINNYLHLLNRTPSLRFDPAPSFVLQNMPMHLNPPQTSLEQGLATYITGLLTELSSTDSDIPPPAYDERTGTSPTCGPVQLAFNAFRGALIAWQTSFESSTPKPPFVPPRPPPSPTHADIGSAELDLPGQPSSDPSVSTRMQNVQDLEEDQFSSRGESCHDEIGLHEWLTSSEDGLAKLGRWKLSQYPEESFGREFLNERATYPSAVTTMVIACDRYHPKSLHDWDIRITNETGITIRDILVSIHENFQMDLSLDDYDAILCDDSLYTDFRKWDKLIQFNMRLPDFKRISCIRLEDCFVYMYLDPPSFTHPRAQISAGLELMKVD